MRLDKGTGGLLPLTDGPRDVRAEGAVGDLNRIIAGLEACRDALATRGSRVVRLEARWEDEENVYYELALGRAAANSADICLSGSRAFIRVDR